VILDIFPACQPLSLFLILVNFFFAIFCRDDFEFMDGVDHTVNVSAFRKLIDACVQILALKLDKKHRNGPYTRMLWISIAIRSQQFNRALVFDAMPKEAAKLWNHYILNEKSSIILTMEAILDIQKGLRLGESLMLPVENQFNASRMSDLLFPSDHIRPLQHIRNFVFNMMGFFRDERQFVSSFLKVSRERYNHLLFPKNPNHTSTLSLKHLYDASNDHTVGGFVQEGVDFLDAVLVVSQERRWASEAFKTECKSWFSLLLKAVEIKKGVENNLGSFLDSGKAVTQHKEYKPHVEAEIIKKMRETFGKLKISTFYPLYKKFRIWNNEFLSDYLQSYSTTHAELSDEHWTLLFNEVVQRSPEPKAHTFILEFILLESTYYAEANKRIAFILDIMKLDVPDLFCDQRGDTSPPGETFKVNLHGYIASSGCSRDLLKCVDTIMDRIYDTPHGFQDLILTVLQKVCE